MDFRSRSLSSEDFEVADHFSTRRLTLSHPERELGQTTTETFVDVYSQLKSEDLFTPCRTSATGIALEPIPTHVPYDYRPKDLPRDLKNTLHHKPTPRDLTLRYWWLPNLEKAEEAKLVGLAQSGDRRAATELFRHFHKFILGIAGKHMRGRPQGNWHRRTDGLFDDLVAAGCVGFSEALRGFDLTLGYRFSTGAWKHICGAISDEAVNFRKRGIKSESDAHRQIFRGSKRPTFKSFQEFAEAYAQVKAWGQRQSYVDDPGSDPSNDLTCGDAEYKDFSPTRWTKHATTRKRDRIDELALNADRHAARRLKQIGRRACALELVEKQQRQLPAESYGYPDYLWTTFGTTKAIIKPLAPVRKTAAVTRIINRQRIKPPRIRVWRAA